MYINDIQCSRAGDPVIIKEVNTMMYEEFIERLGLKTERPTREEYDNIIEPVYVFYPNFGDKEQAAKLYEDFGLVIFRDMVRRAKAVREIQTSIDSFKATLHKLETGEED